MRKSLTIPSSFFEAVQKITESEDRLEFYDLFFYSLFMNKEIDYKKIKSEKVALALAILKPEINKLKSKYENGKQKQDKQKQDKQKQDKSSIFICENFESESELIASKDKKNLSPPQNPPSDYYNNINNKTSDSLINQSVRFRQDELQALLKKIEAEQANEENSVSFSDEQVEKIKLEFDNLSDQLTDNFKIIKNIFEKFSSTNFVKINGIMVKSSTASSKIIEMIKNKQNHEQIELKISELIQKKVSINKTNYYLSSLFNLAVDIEKNEHKTDNLTYSFQNSSQLNDSKSNSRKFNNQKYYIQNKPYDPYKPFMSRHYTDEFYQSLYDDPGEILAEMEQKDKQKQTDEK